MSKWLNISDGEQPSNKSFVWGFCYAALRKIPTTQTLYFKNSKGGDKQSKLLIVLLVNTIALNRRKTIVNLDEIQEKLNDLTQIKMED